MASCKRAVCTAKHHSGESDSTQKYERKLERIVKFITQKNDGVSLSLSQKIRFHQMYMEYYPYEQINVDNFSAIVSYDMSIGENTPSPYRSNGGCLSGCMTHSKRAKRN